MQRDMDLIRQVVLAAESGPPYPKPEGWTDSAIRFHQMLAIKAELLEGTYYSYLENATEIPDVVTISGVSWDGYEFIKAVRDDNNWNKVKNFVVERGMGLTPAALMLAIRTIFG